MLTTSDKVRILKSASIFAGTPDDVLTRVTELLHEEDLPAGHTIFNKGDIGTSMYIIVGGRVRVHDGVRTTNELGDGEVFGEMAVLDASPRSATVTAMEDTRLLRLDQEPLYELMGRYSEVARGIIRVLSGHLRARVLDLSHLHDRKEEVEAELAIGRQIQAGFLPDSLPQSPGWEIAGSFHPAREVAGDFYDAFALADGAMLGVVIADVCGKGVGAALFMALVRSLMRAYAEQNFALSALERVSGEALSGAPPGAADRHSEPLEGSGLASTGSVPSSRASAIEQAVMRTVSATNDYIARTHGKSSMFATLFFGVLDRSTGLLSYVNGGHEPPAMIDEGGVKARLAPTGPAVGLMPGMRFGIASSTMNPGDMLFMFTDGTTDARDPDGNFFTEGRLLELLNSPSLSGASLLELVETQLYRHIAGTSQFDDITLLAVRHAPHEIDGKGR